METLQLGGEDFEISVVWRFANGFAFTSARALPVPPSKSGTTSDGTSRRPVLIQGPARTARNGTPSEPIYEAIFEPDPE
ncbi:MAG: hypothetical protein JST54_07100 [Deltaproteobacteria bacterium]|nr:hypothetical protein [Deltaproteobacteria bacterium]